MEFEIVAENLLFPEGPVWLPDGSVVVVEIAGGQLSRIWPDGSKDVVARPGGGPNGAALGPDGRIYVCNNGGFEWNHKDGLLIPGHQARDYTSGRIEAIDIETGMVQILYDSCGGQRLSGPNDLVFDEHGGFYFTDFGQGRERDGDRGGIYYAKADGSSIVQVIYPIDHPNGCGLSPDGRTLYVAQTVTRTLIAFDLAEPGVLVKGQEGTVFFAGRPIASLPPGTGLDSLAVLEDGRVAVGTIIGLSGIAVMDPVTESYQHHPFPDFATTNICFGGPDMRDAWVTLSTGGRLAKARWDSPGLKLANY